MARKKTNNLGWFRRRRAVYFAALFIICGLVCLFALRHNNLQMISLRNQVYAADKSGQGVETALENLRDYVGQHMNTDLSSSTSINPPIQLKYTYERKARSLAIKPSHDQFYTEAQNVCQAKYPVESSLSVWQGYVDCVRTYLSSHNVNIQISSQPLPPALYKFDFVSPTWSPDLAGWSLVATIVSLILAVVFFLHDFWFVRRRRNE